MVRSHEKLHSEVKVDKNYKKCSMTCVTIKIGHQSTNDPNIELTITQSTM